MVTDKVLYLEKLKHADKYCKFEFQVCLFFSQARRFIPLCAHQVVQAPLSEPSMASWEPLFTPRPGTTVKDMDVVGNHCVLVARTPADELVLIVVPLTHPKDVYTVQVSMTENY